MSVTIGLLLVVAILSGCGVSQENYKAVAATKGKVILVIGEIGTPRTLPSLNLKFPIDFLVCAENHLILVEIDDTEWFSVNLEVTREELIKEANCHI